MSVVLEHETVWGKRLEVLRTDIVSPAGAKQWLVKDRTTGDHYIASGVSALYSGWEVLVFRADADGEVTDWLEVTGGRGISHEDALGMLLSELAP